MTIGEVMIENRAKPRVEPAANRTRNTLKTHPGTFKWRRRVKASGLFLFDDLGEVLPVI
jgi:hypothetical protein